MYSSKTKFLIISIVITLLSVLYSITEYLGYNRYLNIRRQRVENFIYNYKKVPKNKFGTVIVSFVIKDEHGCANFIKSILDQTIRVDQIIGILPRGVKLPDNSYIRNVATIVPSGVNYENSSEIYTAVLREKNPESIIIGLDTSVLYGKDFIEELLNIHETEKDTLLYGDNFILVKPNMFSSIINDDISQRDTEWFIENAKKERRVSRIDCDRNMSCK